MKIVKRVILGLFLLLVLLAGASAVSNLNLPTEADLTADLSLLDQARAAESFHLRQELGDQVWAGWGDAEIPLILHNQEFAYLIAYPDDPPRGWIKIPGGQQEGGVWQPVSGEEVAGRPYYFLPLPGQGATPENFTVRVGERWTATLFTKEFAEVSFYQDFGEGLPVLLRRIIPYRLLWNLIMGNSDRYIQGIAHESFHAYQGMTVPEKLIEAERDAYLGNDYPGSDDSSEQFWKEETELLYQAAAAASPDQTQEFTCSFLLKRTERRDSLSVSEELADYERHREWLEGLAKYAELSLGLAAARSNSYQPVPQISQDPEFKSYSGQERFWKQQLLEVKRQSSQGGDTRFYYTGLAQAVVLDRLNTEWKSQAFQPGIWLEDLLLEQCPPNEMD